jgi:hypothetical protein
MNSINRSLAIIKPKQPYIKWANSLPDDDREYVSEVFQKDCFVVLIHEYGTEKEAVGYINKMWRMLFKEQLEGWCLDTEWWPKNITQKMFWKWFDVEFHSVVVDSLEETIEKEE